MTVSIALACVFVSSYLITGLVRHYARKHALMDLPGARSSHKVPTPRGGGLAIVITLLASISLLRLGGHIATDPFYALSGGALLAGVGFWDDRSPVPAPWRMVVHFSIAAWALYWVGGIPPIPAAGSVWHLGWVGQVMGLFGLVWLLNVFNFMDGIDGLAGAQSLCVIAGACLLIALGGSDRDLLVLGALGAATLGFLVWNWPPARIFLGDVGSAFLGFVLGVLALDTAHAGVLSVWCWVILLGVFLVDATVTLARRVLRRERWYQAHRSHAYQHAAARWGSHRRVTLAVVAIDLVWLLPLAWFVSEHPAYDVGGAVLALVPLVAAALALRAGLSSGPRVKGL